MVTAANGKSVAMVKARARLSLMTCRAAVATKLNNANHQNSGRDAHPWKSAYFTKHVRTASKKVMGRSGTVLCIVAFSFSRARWIQAREFTAY